MNNTITHVQAMRAWLHLSTRLRTEPQLRVHEFRHLRLGLPLRLSTDDARLLGKPLSTGKGLFQCGKKAFTFFLFFNSVINRAYRVNLILEAPQRNDEEVSWWCERRICTGDAWELGTGQSPLILMAFVAHIYEMMMLIMIMMMISIIIAVSTNESAFVIRSDKRNVDAVCLVYL